MSVADEPVYVTLFRIEGDDEREVSISRVLKGRPAFLIGSDPRSHLQLNDAAASHALVIRKQNAYFIQPRLSQTTVLVNGKRISSPTCLLPDDRVQIGPTVLRFEQHEGDTEPAAPAVEPVKAPPVKPRMETLVYTPARPAAVAAAVPAAETVVHYPQESAQQRSNVAALALGVITILAIIGVVGFGTFSSLGGTPTGAEAVSFAYNDGNVTMLMFEAEWCTYCAQQRPVVERMAADYRGDLYVEYVDIDNPANRGLVNRFGARSIPLIVIFNDQGEVVHTYRGLTSDRALRSSVDAGLAMSTGSAVVERG